MTPTLVLLPVESVRPFMQDGITNLVEEVRGIEI